MLLSVITITLAIILILMYQRKLAPSPYSPTNATQQASDDNPVYFDIPTITVSVNASKPTALRAHFTLVLTDKDGIQEMSHNLPILQDEINSILTSLSITDTKGPVGQEKIKESIARIINKKLTGTKVKEVLITEFIVQQ